MPMPFLPSDSGRPWPAQEIGLSIVFVVICGVFWFRVRLHLHPSDTSPTRPSFGIDSVRCLRHPCSASCIVVAWGLGWGGFGSGIARGCVVSGLM